jgi:hypothetical protein
MPKLCQLKMQENNKTIGDETLPGIGTGPS